MGDTFPDTIETIPLPPVTVVSYPVPEPPPPKIPNCFYVAKNGLVLANTVAFVLTFISFAMWMSEKDLNFWSMLISSICMIRALSLVFIPLVIIRYEHRVGLIAVAIISLIQYPIAMFASRFFVGEHYACGGFVLVAIFAIFFVNRMDKFCKLNPGRSAGPEYLKRKIKGSNGQFKEVFATQTVYVRDGLNVRVPKQQKIQIGRKW